MKKLGKNLLETPNLLCYLNYAIFANPMLLIQFNQQSYKIKNKKEQLILKINPKSPKKRKILSFNARQSNANYARVNQKLFLMFKTRKLRKKNQKDYKMKVKQKTLKKKNIIRQSHCKIMKVKKVIINTKNIVINVKKKLKNIKIYKIKKIKDVLIQKT